LSSLLSIKEEVLSSFLIFLPVRGARAEGSLPPVSPLFVVFVKNGKFPRCRKRPSWRLNPHFLDKSGEKSLLFFSKGTSFRLFSPPFLRVSPPQGARKASSPRSGNLLFSSKPSVSALFSRFRMFLTVLTKQGAREATSLRTGKRPPLETALFVTFLLFSAQNRRKLATRSGLEAATYAQAGGKRQFRQNCSFLLFSSKPALFSSFLSKSGSWEARVGPGLSTILRNNSEKRLSGASFPRLLEALGSLFSNDLERRGASRRPLGRLGTAQSRGEDSCAAAGIFGRSSEGFLRGRRNPGPGHPIYKAP